MKVAVYIRVSTLEQAEEGYSIGEQKDKLRKYCEIKDWTVVKEYVDPGRSGSNLDRPSMQQLIKDAPKGLYDAVLVYKLDRLSRSQKDTLYLIEDVFQKNDIHFVSLSENFDTSTAFGKAMIGILSVFAQLEREQIKERMTMGRIGRVKSGKIMEFNNPPFGYEVEDDNYKVKPLQGAIVKKIYDMYLSGKSISKIKETLNEEGHVGNPYPWSDTRVRYILSNPTYIGKIPYRGKLYDGRFTPLVNDATFSKVQQELKERQVSTAKRFNMQLRPFQSKYMLSGILKCGYCGATLFVNSYVQPNGHRRLRYNCPSTYKSMQKAKKYAVKDPNCPFKLVYAEKLEPVVINEIKKLALHPDSIRKPKTIHHNGVDVAAVKKELASIKKQQQKLIDLYVISDDINIENISKKSADLKIQEEALTKKLSQAVEPDNGKLINFQNLLAKSSDIDQLSYDEQKFIVKKLIKSIDVYNDDRIKINWNI